MMTDDQVLEKATNLHNSHKSAAQVHAATAALFETLAARLSAKTEASIFASDVRDALTVALAETFGVVGGVVLVWYDELDGLRVNLTGWEER